MVGITRFNSCTWCKLEPRRHLNNIYESESTVVLPEKIECAGEFCILFSLKEFWDVLYWISTSLSFETLLPLWHVQRNWPANLDLRPWLFSYMAASDAPAEFVNCRWHWIYAIFWSHQPISLPCRYVLNYFRLWWLLIWYLLMLLRAGKFSATLIVSAKVESSCYFSQG